MLKWETVAVLGIGSRDDQGSTSLLMLALKLDDLAADLERESRDMAEKFAEYAGQCALGHVHSPPTSYSSIGDIDRKAAEYGVLSDQFRGFFFAVTGRRYGEVLKEASAKSGVGS